MSSQMSDKSNNLVNNRMIVNVRVRPFNQSEHSVKNNATIAVVDNHFLVFDPKDDTKQHVYHRNDIKEKVNKNLKFKFDRVFNESVNNSEVYEQSVKGLVASLLDGYNCAVFAYGSTGSGKTHTMIGTDDDPGVIFLTINDLFRQKQEMRSDEQLDLSVSYFEIYNEVVIYLLNITSGKALTVRDDSKRGVIFNNLSVHYPKHANDLQKMLKYGNKKRTQHPTDANGESSRSHAVFQISIKNHDISSSSIQISKMSLIDLAGSERVNVAHNSNRSKRLQREGANINKSLLTLGRCITALADNNSTRKIGQHIPYRDSKLTLILRDCLGGNCQTVMIATISPSTVHCEQTHNTLVYANRAKGIQLDLKRNSFLVGIKSQIYESVIESLKRKIAEQTNECNVLREEVKKLRNINIRTNNDSYESTRNDNRSPHRLEEIKLIEEQLPQSPIDLNTPKTRQMTRYRNPKPKQSNGRQAEQILDNVRTSDITKHALFIQDVKRNKETVRKTPNGVYFCHLCGKDNDKKQKKGKTRVYATRQNTRKKEKKGKTN